MAPISETAVHLIVNADDFGYFEEVTRGIVEAADSGVVTAIGIMANGPVLEHWIRELNASEALSVGVHLNATLGRPLTSRMCRELASNDCEFPAKYELTSRLLLRRLSINVLLSEWRAQIQRCLNAGLTIDFLNSHEHVHMLPGLYERVWQLACEFGIDHVRAPRSEWRATIVARSGFFRCGLLAVAKAFTPELPKAEPLLIGLAPSGRLNLAYCQWCFSRLRRGATYELMCHPGWPDAKAKSHPGLSAYHDWEGELRMLLSQDFQRLLRDNQIRLTKYTSL